MSNVNAVEGFGFTALGLSTELQSAAAALGWPLPTSIQKAAITPILAGRDVLALAATGSGKTAAFALPLVQMQARPPGADRTAPRQTLALLLVPTRELAAQVAEVIQGLADIAVPSLKLAALFGGVSVNPQMMSLRGGADVVVATPGRLLDLVSKNALRLGDVRLLVLDEADRLLDDGFANELAHVVALLPKQRQTLMFSATFPPAVRALAQGLLHEPLQLDVRPDKNNDEGRAALILQRAICVDTARRTPLLRHLIGQEKWPQVLVFVATTYGSELVASKLCAAGVNAAPFHGELSQGARTQILRDFKSGELLVLIATDLASRGIDIDQLPVVLNYDLARSPVDHVHRIGRTGRAGAAGQALSFVSASTEAHFRLIEKRQGYRVPREVIAGFEPKELASETTGTGGIKGKRPNKKDKLRAAASQAAEADQAEKGS